MSIVTSVTSIILNFTSIACVRQAGYLNGLLTALPLLPDIRPQVFPSYQPHSHCSSPLTSTLTSPCPSAVSGDYSGHSPIGPRRRREGWRGADVGGRAGAFIREGEGAHTSCYSATDFATHSLAQFIIPALTQSLTRSPCPSGTLGTANATWVRPTA